MDRFAQIRAASAPTVGCSGVAFTPSPADVDRLIARARRHPLGLEFLRNGVLDAVAATFGVHAFVVDHARERLG